MTPRTALAAGLLLAAAVAPAQEPTQEPAQEPQRQQPQRQQQDGPATAGIDLGTPEAARAGADRALAWLLANQHPDGGWSNRSPDSQFDAGFAVETYYCWQVGAHCLATLALLRAPETPARRAALDRAVDWLVTTEMPLRGSNWDNDAVWAWLYGTVATTELAGDPRFDTDQWRERVHGRGREFVRWLERNQVPTGGFGYYDDPTFSRRPKWATSFSTAAVLPALGIALQLGWANDPETVQRAAAYVRRCRLPNGAFEYDLNPVPRLSGGEHINQIKGSLGRIQVCHWALRLAGDDYATDDRVRWGVEQLLENQRFLRVARMRPIPHEAYYANAGYFFFFGHFYCSQAIELLPQGEREGYHARLRPHVLQAQRPDGSFCDFQDTSYMTTSSTAFAVMTLLAGLPRD